MRESLKLPTSIDVLISRLRELADAGEIEPGEVAHYVQQLEHHVHGARTFVRRKLEGLAERNPTIRTTLERA